MFDKASNAKLEDLTKWLLYEAEKLVGSSFNADALVQEILGKERNWPKLQDKSIPYWLKALKHQYFDWKEAGATRKRNEGNYVDPEDDQKPPLPRPKDLRTFVMVLHNLTPMQKRFFRTYAESDGQIENVAETLGQSPAYVRDLKYKTRKRMEKMFEQWKDEFPPDLDRFSVTETQELWPYVAWIMDRFPKQYGDSFDSEIGDPLVRLHLQSMLFDIRNDHVRAITCARELHDYTSRSEEEERSWGVMELARTLLNSGEEENWHEAKELLKCLLFGKSVSPGVLFCQYQLAIAEKQLRNFQEARNTFQCLLQIGGNSQTLRASLINQLGEVCLHEGIVTGQRRLIVEAIDCFNDAFDGLRHDAWPFRAAFPLENLGKAMGELDRSSESTRYLHQAYSWFSSFSLSRYCRRIRSSKGFEHCLPMTMAHSFPTGDLSFPTN